MFIEIRDPDQFKQFLAKKGITAAGLGRAAGVSEDYATRIINGELNPGPQVAQKICKVFGFIFEDIFSVNHSMLSGTKMGGQGWDNPVRTNRVAEEIEKDDK